MIRALPSSMRLVAVTLVAVAAVTLSSEALATPRPKKGTRSAASPKPKPQAAALTTAPRDASAGDAERVLASAEAADSPTVEVVSGPPRPSGVIGPIALDPERAKPPPLAAAPSAHSEQRATFTPPMVTWPIYTAGAIGLSGLAGAVVLGSLTADANHAIEVADVALSRAGVTRARCAQPTARTPFEATCSTIRRNEGTLRSLDGTAAVALVVGITGVAFAIGWYVFAPRELPRREQAGSSGRAAIATPRVTPWIGASSGGAFIEGRF